MADKTGVLLVGFGGPRSLDEVAPMLERILGSMPPEPVIASAKEKYQIIGGKSPVVEITQNIATELAAACAQDEACADIAAVEVGMCYSEPSITEGLTKLVDAGCTRVVYLATTAFETCAAWDAPYVKTVEAAAELGITGVIKAPVFGTSSVYLRAHVDYIQKESFQQMQKVFGESTHVPGAEIYTKPIYLIMVAHSLNEEDPCENALRFEQQMLTSGSIILSSLHTHVETGVFAYVSAGKRGGKWLGPTLIEELEEVKKLEGVVTIVCPLGFATDHMEVLYDIDIEAREAADKLELEWHRTPTLATLEAINPALIEAMAGSVKKALAAAKADS
ncbi:MAG: ferrochelatase [Coriobacteriia bacterium]|nr:ferrochelatase [Coriobacteriia bacterium]